MGNAHFLNHTSQVTDDDFENGLIYPRVNEIVKVSVNVAVRIAEKVFESGLAGVSKPDKIRDFIKNRMYVPVYKSS